MTPSIPPPDYYLNYFRQMVLVVSERYADILNPEDQAFIHRLNQCSDQAARLLVRLYLRKGPNFLVNKLNYAEVTDLDSAVIELVTAELAELNPVVFGYEMVELLPIAVSREIFSDDPKCRKADLVDAWLDDDELRTCSEWGVEEPVITPCHYETVRRLQLMYFGNARQDLTEFILEDLGLFKYEQYRLDKSNRLFNRAEDIEQLIALQDLSADFYLLNDSKDWSNLNILAEAAEALVLPENLAHKWHRLLNRIAYRLEQLGELERALTLFQTNDQPPSRERKARILFKLERYEEAWIILQAIASNPLSTDEPQFYRRFANKVRDKLGLKKIVQDKPLIKEFQVTWPKGDVCVELLATEHFNGSVWLENQLPMAVFGLIYWPVIFADVSGVWHHPFQSGPTDLTEAEFSLRRKAILDDIARHSLEQWREAIQNHWQQKNGVRNPFVNWSALSLDLVLTCFDALSHHQWQAIFNHILSDIRHHRSGFPDLFQVNDGQYRFIEIKGPGDKLQDNQIAWLTVFQQNNINAEVCYVRYAED